MVRRFGLIMGDGEDVRSLEELREHFDLEKVMEYYYKENGDLLTWLDRLGCEDEAQTIRALDSRAPDFPLKLCQALEVECKIEVDAEKVKTRMHRLARLKLVTDEPEHHRNIDFVAFNQEELAQLVLDEGERKIFLCQDGGERFIFTIPSSCRDVTYIGIPCGGVYPRVRVTGADIDWKKERGIDIQFCQIDRKKPAKAEPGETGQDHIAPIQAFWEAVAQKGLNQVGQAAVTVTAAGPEPRERKFEVKDSRSLWEHTALLVQEVLAEGKILSGLKLTAGGITCALGMDSGTLAKARVRGVHMERDSGGRRAIYLDLDRSVELKGRRYRAVLLRSASIYEKLNLLEGSVVELICLGDLPPAVRMMERGNGTALCCPHCGSKFMFRDETVFCENPICIDRLNGRIFRFLEALGLEQCDRSFVQTLMTRCSVHSLKEMFALNREQMRKCGLDDGSFRDFPETLRKAVTAAPDHVLLGKLGVPSLWQRQAKDILERYGRTESDPFGAFLRDLDHEAWSAAIDSAVGKEKSIEIQYWLRCDCRSVKIFRDDLRALYSVRPSVSVPLPSQNQVAKRQAEELIQQPAKKAVQKQKSPLPAPKTVPATPPAKSCYSSVQKAVTTRLEPGTLSYGCRVAIAGIPWETQKTVRSTCEVRGYKYVGIGYEGADVLVIPYRGYDYQSRLSMVRNPPAAVLDLNEFFSTRTVSNEQKTVGKKVAQNEPKILPRGKRVAADVLTTEVRTAIRMMCLEYGHTFVGADYDKMDVLVVSSRKFLNGRAAQIAKERRLPIYTITQFNEACRL